jgi:predicted nucleic acid-binding protein
VILVDSSIWVDHLRIGNAKLARMLDDGRVISHPFVVGELALGSLRRRESILSSLQELPQAVVASDAEVLRFINQQALHGLGIGYVDAHLLASVRLTAGGSLWTRDKRLQAVADRLGVAAALSG